MEHTLTSWFDSYALRQVFAEYDTSCDKFSDTARQFDMPNNNHSDESSNLSASQLDMDLNLLNSDPAVSLPQVPVNFQHHGNDMTSYTTGNDNLPLFGNSSMIQYPFSNLSAHTSKSGPETTSDQYWIHSDTEITASTSDSSNRAARSQLQYPKQDSIPGTFPNSQASDSTIYNPQALPTGEPSNASNDLDELAFPHGTVYAGSVNDGGLLPLEVQRRKRVQPESSDMSTGPSTKRQCGEHAHFPAENATLNRRSRFLPPIEAEVEICEAAVSLFRCWMRANPGIFPDARRLIGFELITGISYENLHLWFQEQFQGATQSTEKSIAASPIYQNASKGNAKNLAQGCRNIPDGVKAENRKKPWVKEMPYSCTSLCGRTSRAKHDFKRHEELTYPQKGFLCILCWYSGNVFNRKDHVTSHAKRVHPTADLNKFEIARKVEILADFPRRCGFCGVLFHNWDHRIDHIADHFEKSWTMSSWKDSWIDPLVTEGTSNDSNENNENNNNGGDDDNSDRVVDIFSCHSITSTWKGAPSLNANEYSHRPHIHSLSPTAFLPRAADIEPNATAIHHVTANSRTICLTYRDFADRSRGLAYYLRKFGHKHVGILCPNTPASIISIFGIAAAGAINTTANCQLNTDEIDHVFDHSEVDAIIVDREFVGKLDRFTKNHPNVKIIVDEDNEGSGQFHDAFKEGLQYDEKERGGWDGLKAQPDDEDSLIAVAYTSGTTAKPKGAEYTHRGAYLATMGNIIESGLNYHQGRVRYLWVSHMSHAMGWTFPWAVTAVRGTHYCLRNVDCGQIWGLLKKESITHFNASPAVGKQLCAHPSAELLPDSVHVSVAGSSPTPRLFESMTELNLQPVHIYGLTETYGPVTKGYFMPACNTIPAEDRYKKTVRQRHGFVTSLPIRVIKADLPEGQIENVKQDGKEIGEIVFVGNVCVKGYHKDPDATRKLFAGGVLHSGDLAVWHDDGSAQILGRQEDIITTGEEKISSVAIESILEEHPDILEAGVIAVPDEVLRERPKAYITIKPGAQISGEALIEWVKRKEIRKVMVPQEVQIVRLLPRTSTGKLKKDDMKRWAKCDEKKL